MMKKDITIQMRKRKETFLRNSLRTVLQTLSSGKPKLLTVKSQVKKIVRTKKEMLDETVRFHKNI